ncbi:retinol dehydrogenase 11-like [Haliotis rubra]|uniref:retinol dehydrogenase 11-like n=1 Tax=Haliotis rubra TaxID=36100 RepID=UPI001EE54741|nr:retinol dehydrogenase 11-like [Haliotis rubra]
MSMKNLKVDELEENIDEVKEVVEDVFSALVATVVVSCIILFVILLRVYIRWGTENPSRNKMEGKTVIITGANTGLGKATAIELAKRKARVILGIRDKNKGEAVARSIKKKTGNQNVFAEVLDLANLRSIQDFVYRFNDKESALHVLINNAGYMGPKASTNDGIERCLGVNHLGHFYLTLLLKEKLKKCAPSRVINVVSDAYLKGKLDFEDLAMTKSYDIYKAYCRSKLAQMVFSMECHRHFFSDVVCSYAVHPGPCCTDLLRNWPGMNGNMLRAMARILFKTPEEGCQTIVYCAVADKLREHSGKLFVNCKAQKMKEIARDKTRGSKLWAVSLQLCGLPPEIMEEEEEVVTPEKPKDADLKKREGAAAAAQGKESKLPVLDQAKAAAAAAAKQEAPPVAKKPAPEPPAKPQPAPVQDPAPS